jgi:glycosyltransferase involved in cell wall biosynthesis
MKKYKYDLSLILPCYNEASHLSDSLLRITKVLDNTRFSYEIILIDDCSVDNTLSIIKDVVKKSNNMKYLVHAKNMGRGYTVREGLLIADGNVAGFVDIDLEMDAHYIPAFISSILDYHYDISIGYRFYHLQITTYSLLRIIFSFIYRRIVWYILKLPFKDTEAGCKFFKVKTTKELIENTYSNKWFWDTEIVANAYMRKLNIKEIPTVFIRNPSKKSTVKVIRDSWQYLKDIHRFIKKNSG